jgi:hypothetical protein
MLKKIVLLTGIMLVLLQMAANPQRASAANVMNYGADGNDYFQFTTPSMAFDKASGFTTLITFAMHVNADGTLLIGGDVACTNGVYTGPTNWNSLITTLKTPPTTVARYEVCIGGWTDTSFDNIRSLAASQGTGPSSILYKNFQALKNAVTGIDAINDDDEKTYDLSSSTSFANMLGGLGYKFTLVPYQNQSFWVNLKNAITNCDYVYVQCYEGGAGNDPGQWQSAMGSGVVVIGGQESNTANLATWRSWYLETGVQGGFYYPDVVFNSTYWSAAIMQGNGTAPPVPAGVKAISGSGQVSLSWNTAPGAMSYNVWRSTRSGGETNYVSISSDNAWPACNQHIDTGVTNGTTYYYEVSALNTNGTSLNSPEVSATPLLAIVSDFGFEVPSIGTGNYAYNPSGAAWTFSGASPNGSGIVGNGSAFSNPNAPEGVQAAFLQENGTISQTISGFAPGTNYTITFLAAERPGNVQSWNMRVNGAVIASFNPGSSATAYVDYTATFTATAATETLAFVGTDLAGGDNTIFIDDVQIVASGASLSPVPTTTTLPVTAVDVVGSQVAFTAAFTAPSPMTYQWQKISGGVTNNVAGATSTTLILANLQLTNTAIYQLQASNAYGEAVSSPSSLTVSSVPAPVNNVIASYAAQTGIGTGSFMPTWPFTTNNNLVAGQSPSSTNGDFNLEPFWGNRNVSSLTAGGDLTLSQGGNPTTTSVNYVTCGNGTGNNGAGSFVPAGSLLIYTLTNSFAGGYNLTNITVYGGWKDAGRDQQAYTVYYSKVAAPGGFILLGTVNYNPANVTGAECATRATLTPAHGPLATNVAAVKFDFTAPTTPNGYCGYSQIELFGIPVQAQPATNPTNITFQVTANGLTLNWPVDHIGWHLQTQTNDLAQGLGTNWVDVTNSTTTNQMTIPINSTNGGVFYRLTYP